MKLKFCGYCGHEKLTPERRIEFRQRFEGLHKNGAEAFKQDWLKANDLAIDAARTLDIDYTDPAMRTLLSLVCYRILSMNPKPETKETGSND